MAATQAEKQQNDVNSEKVQSDQHLNVNVRNSLLQNGTDKSSARGGGGVGVVHTKAKNTAGKNIAIEMSQYRQDSGGGGSTTIPGQTNSGSGSGPTSSSVSGQGPNEPGLSGEPESTAGATTTTTDSNIYSSEGNSAPSPSATDGHGYGFPYGRDVHNSGEGGIHAFGPRQPFGAPKQMPPHQPHQRFVTGPSISQTSGPTPTLNQLLQSNNNTMPHRYPNSYGHPDQHYNQAWPPQKPIQQGYSPGPPGSSGPPPGAPPAGSYRTQPTLSPAYGGGSASSPGYSESRSNWQSGPSGPGGHGPGPGPGPGSPGQSNSSAPVSQPSPQPSQPPSHSPGPGPGMPPSPQHQPHQGFPSRPAPPTTPNAHGPDAADLSGGNSNDSSGGPAPGTPNSQGMRPTPSPTGSTGSRSMSPAVGQNIPMPPRPSSGQSDGNGPSRISHSPMVTQGSYTTPHSSPHPAHGYKSHPSMVVSGSGNQQMPLYQPNQYPQTGYPPRPPSNIQYPGQGGYGPPTSQPPPPNNMPPQQFPGRSAPNHMQNSQFPPYQQSWQSSMSTSSKGNGPNPPTQTPGSQSPGPTTRPPHYLKHHLQHKMGFQNVPGSTPPSPSPPQNYHMGPPSGHHHSGMGPPPSMGPPNMPPGSSPLLPNNHPHDGPMPPPSSTPNSHTQMVSDMMDNGITTTAQGGLNTHVTTATGGSVTSVVTTGPDGTPIDEGSQQSTLSNASAASGEDPQCTTPKASRKNDMGLYSHPTTPQSTVPSPGAASINSMHEDYGELGSPSWPRTPASPVFNSHVPPPDTYRSKKTDSLSKLYEMDENPERKAWLDKLLAFMDDRRTPITTCPTISKNPLDLFRLYMFVKDRGGFMEVTNNKTWKDIAGMLGIGASSSAAYTLRKHYTKNLLAYECQFDRGGIDPQPLINKVEATSKKKSAKATSVPSPGSSNSQDSFPPGSAGASMDGYVGYGGYPPSGNPDYPPQRPSSQSAPSPHGAGVNHHNNAAPGGPSPAGGAADNVSVSNPFDDVSPSPPPRGGPFPGGPHPSYPAGTPPRPPGQNYSGQPGYQYPGPGPGSGAPPDQYSSYPASSGYPPAVRPVYPPYSGDSAAPPPSPNNAQGPPSSAAQDPYRYNANPGSGYNPRPAYGQAPSNTGPPTSQPAGSGNYPPHPDYYRPEQVQQGTGTGAGYTGGTNANKNMPPPAPQPPRRHPDFAKDQPYAYGQPRTPMYGGWPNNNQYRPPQYGGTPGGPQVAPQQWNQTGRPGGPWPSNQNYQQQQPGQPPWPGMAQPTGQNANMRPVHRPGKPFPNIMPPSAGGKGNQAQPTPSNTYSHSQMPKREITFPPDSVEATVPVLYRRKRLCRSDVGQIDAWRIIMCLRSGLLSESTYALDMLNVLLFDDSSVGYFGLNQWPGLLDLLMEHFKCSLADMFDGPYPREDNNSVEPEVDLGGVTKPIDPNLKTIILHETTNYTLVSRKGHPVKLVDRPEDIFVQDHVKDWDTKGDPNRANILAEIPSDPWYTNADHILPPFQAEFGHIPFHMRLDDDNVKSEEEDNDLERKIKSPPPDETPPDETPPPPPPTNICDKKPRTKSLLDVIYRITHDSEASETPSLESTNKIKTEELSEEVNCEESPSIDLNISVNGECGDTKGQSVRDPSGTLKRRRISDYEDEAYTRDEASLMLLTESQDNIGKRCVCLSNILRSLTFIPGNEIEFVRSGTFLALIGKLLLLHHEHPPRTQKTRNYDREEDADFADSCSSLQGESEWWWDFLVQIRENILVSVSNIAGQIDVSLFDEEVARPLLDGLLHWAICPSATGQDPFASVGPTSLLSPQRLALEALCKLCVTNSNVDLVIATPPFSRLERLCTVLTKHLCRSEDQVLREFSINLLHYLAAADSSMARVVASQTPCVSLLVAFIEQAEQSAMGVANQHGISALRENPDSMGTSLDMLRRAAATLVFLARHPENKPLLVQQESRLLALVMSQILDQQVALLLSKVLFQISRS